MTAALDRVIHACTVTTAPTGGGPPWAPTRLRVRAACSCLLWEAEGTVNPEAPAYDPAEMPTRLRTLHRDHCADTILAAAGHRDPFLDHVCGCVAWTGADCTCDEQTPEGVA